MDWVSNSHTTILLASTLAITPWGVLLRAVYREFYKMYNRIIRFKLVLPLNFFSKLHSVSLVAYIYICVCVSVCARICVCVRKREQRSVGGFYKSENEVIDQDFYHDFFFSDQ